MGMKRRSLQVIKIERLSFNFNHPRFYEQK